jgi:hypothetical protein
MDLQHNKISISEIIDNPRGKVIITRNFPEIMNPFLLHIARNMTLENTMKLATGRYAQDQVRKLISDLEAI